MSNTQKDITWLWILLPAIFAIFGGVIAYFALKHDDLKYARMSLYLGVVMTGIVLPGMLVSILFGAMFGMGAESMFMDSAFEEMPMDSAFEEIPMEEWAEMP